MTTKEEIEEVLQSLTDEEIKAEVQRRADVTRERNHKAAKDRAEAFSSRLTRDIVDFLVPDHDRTSCSDESLCNEFRGNRLPRCNRCALLQVAQEGVPWPLEFNLRLTVEICSDLS